MEPPSSLVILGIAFVSRICTGQAPQPREDLHSSLAIRPEVLEKSETMCSELRREPYFEPEMVAWSLWKVVYMWNMDVGPKCIDIRFKLATTTIIKRFYFDMHDYLEEQPAWEAASLLLKIGLMKRELLLFDDDGLAGKFVAVPNVLRDGREAAFSGFAGSEAAHYPPMRHAVPLMKFQMKLTRDGRYLVLMDCLVGFTSIAARDKTNLNRTEITAIAESIESSLGSVGSYLGTGYHACVPQKEDTIISRNLNK